MYCACALRTHNICRCVYRCISTAYPLRHLDHQEPLVEGGEAKLEMTPIRASRER
jgi:hypothetical protein